MSKQAKHTPGTWDILGVENSEVIIAKGGKQIAICDGPRRLQNARLIAEAPPMAILIHAILKRGKVTTRDCREIKAILSRIYED